MTIPLSNIMDAVQALLKDLEHLVGPRVDGRLVLQQLAELYRSTQILDQELRRNGMTSSVLLYEPDGLAASVVDEAKFVEAVQAVARLVSLGTPLVLGEGVPQQLGLDVGVHLDASAHEDQHGAEAAQGQG